MKKLFLLGLSFVIATSMFTACGNKKDADNTPSTPSQEESNTTQDELGAPTDDTTGGTTEGGSTGIGESGTDTTTGAGMILAEGTKLDDIVMKLGEELGITMPEKVDDTTLVDIMGLNKDDVEEYYGEYAVVNTSADNIIAIKANEGKADTVKKALEERKNAVVKNFEQYLPEQLDKAKAGKVIQRGNYVFLVIAGNSEKGMDNEIKRAEEIIDSYFTK